MISLLIINHLHIKWNQSMNLNETQTQRGDFVSSSPSPTPHWHSPSFQRNRGEVTAIACAGVLKGSTSAPFFCHAEINNRWFVFNAQFPLYYYRQCSDGLGLRQSSHDSLSLFLSLSFTHSGSFSAACQMACTNVACMSNDISLRSHFWAVRVCMEKWESVFWV